MAAAVERGDVVSFEGDAFCADAICLVIVDGRESGRRLGVLDDFEVVEDVVIVPMRIGVGATNPADEVAVDKVEAKKSTS